MATKKKETKKESKFLNRNDIMSADDIKSEEVDVSKWWGGKVMVYSLTGHERDELETWMEEQRKANPEQNIQNMRAKLVTLCVKDEDGKPVFTPADVLALGKKASAPIQKLFDVATNLSAVTDVDIDTLTKN